MSDVASTVLQESQTYPWYAIRTKTHFESVTCDSLTGKGYEAYLPAYRNRRTWSDRIVELNVSLFPQYLFCRFDVLRRLPILTTPGILSIVSFGKQPEPIMDEEIDAVKMVLASGVLAQPCPFLREGQKVRVLCGPLVGLEGILVKKKTQYRMVISVAMLQRSVSVEIDGAWIVDAR